MAIRVRNNNTAVLNSTNAELKATLSNTVINNGTTDYNELENKPDLSKYAITRISKMVDFNEETETPIYEHYDMTQEDFAIRFGSTEECALAASELAVQNADNIELINTSLENKADKEHNHDYNNLENLPDLEKYAVKKTIEYKDTTPEQLKISENTSVIRMNILQDTTIVLPTSLGFSDANEITLFLNIIEEAVVSFDNVALWQNEPVLEAGTVCELIFSWSGSEWLGGCIVYGKQL